MFSRSWSHSFTCIHTAHTIRLVCVRQETRLIASVVTQTQLPQPEHIKYAVNTGKAELASAILGRDRRRDFYRLPKKMIL